MRDKTLGLLLVVFFWLFVFFARSYLGCALVLLHCALRFRVYTVFVIDLQVSMLSQIALLIVGSRFGFSYLLLAFRSRLCIFRLNQVCGRRAL